ncbi:MAG: HEAT repeat domain-containing protein, partial [candidate division WOR-3 bacterium]
SAWVRSVSAQALGEIGEIQAAPVLLHALDDPDRYVRASVAEALGKLRDYRSSMKLLEMVDDESDLVRAQVFRALGRIGNPAAIPSLLKALDDPEPQVRCAAIEALAELRVVSIIDRLRAITRPWPFSREPKEVKEIARWAIDVLTQALTAQAQSSNNAST